ncbi:hypothetical protein F2981_11135 [Sinorhizobium meliloti]|nr:hypothetical protein [Sinorhizobium meliloti]
MRMTTATAPLCGTDGEMLERMLSGIGLSREDVLLANATLAATGKPRSEPREADICRPFIERQIALAEPKQLLLLGNFTSRFFFGGETIHHCAANGGSSHFGGTRIPTLATLHPRTCRRSRQQALPGWTFWRSSRASADTTARFMNKV